jgi:hypothetical protein
VSVPRCGTAATRQGKISEEDKERMETALAEALE